jgi:hypothetical protein
MVVDYEESEQFPVTEENAMEMHLPPSLAFIWVGKRISKVKTCLGRVVDILEASGAFDPGSNPGRGV